MPKGTVARVLLVTAATAAGTVVRRINAYREAHRTPAPTPEYRPSRHFEPELWRQALTVTAAGHSGGEVIATLTADTAPSDNVVLAELVP